MTIPREKYALTEKLESLLLAGRAGGSRADPHSAAGRYRVPGGGILTVAESGGRLLLRPHGQAAVDRLVAGADHDETWSGHEA